MKTSPLLKITLLLTSMMTMMAGAVVAPSLPQINEVFRDVPHAALLSRLVITLPAIFIAIFSPLYGQLIDKHGRKKWLLISLTIYALSGTSGFFLNDLYLILVGRALLGIAVAGVMTIATTLIGDYFTGAERGAFMGFQGAFIGIGGVLFITVAGWLADVQWQMPFLIYLFAVPVLIMGWIFLYEPNVAHQKEFSQKTKSDNTYNKFIVAIIYTTVFVSVVFFYMLPVQLPFMLSDLGVNNKMIGIAISTSTLFSSILAMNYRHIRKFVSFPGIFVISFALMGIGYYCISLSTSYTQFLCSIAIGGSGVGLLMPTGSLWIMDVTPPEMRGRFVSGVSTSMFLGMFFSPIFMQPLVQNKSYSYSFAIASLGLGLMAALYFAFKKKLR